MQNDRFGGGGRSLILEDLKDKKLMTRVNGVSFNRWELQTRIMTALFTFFVPVVDHCLRSSSAGNISFESWGGWEGLPFGCACVSRRVCACACVWCGVKALVTRAERDRQTDRQIDRQTDRRAKTFDALSNFFFGQKPGKKPDEICQNKNKRWGTQNKTFELSVWAN